MDDVEIRPAARDDVAELARLLWWHAPIEQQACQSVEDFAAELGGWWRDHRNTHLAFVASDGDGPLVGVAWLALLPRVPRPGLASRRSADIQSVFVIPDRRGHGVGSALVEAATQQAFRLGAGRVTVGSGRTATPVYERLGFSSSPQLLQRHP